MKQSPLFLCRIVSIIFFFSSIINAVDMLQLSQTHALGDISYGLPVYDQDGFAPGTLVQTISGYQYIDDLAEADDVIDEYGQERRIVRTTKKLVDWYLELGIADSIICVGPDQQFYLLPENSWVKARELNVGGFLQGV